MVKAQTFMTDITPDYQIFMKRNVRMNKRKQFYIWILLTGLLLNAGVARAQKPATNPAPQPQATSAAVTGGGTPEQLVKWTGVNGQNSFTVGNSIITETKFGLIGIGTLTPSSKLSVVGTIESLNGGFKFPDGSVQATAGLSAVFRDATLIGNGTAGLPLGIAPGGVGTLQLGNGAVTGEKLANGSVVRSFNGLFDNIQLAAGSNVTITPAGNTLTIAAVSGLGAVAHDETLAGDGSAASPLKIPVPLFLEGGIGSSVITASSIGINSAGVTAFGSDDDLFFPGNGLQGVGGEARGQNNRGGSGVAAFAGLGFEGAVDGLAGDFAGDVFIEGSLAVTGSKNFKIDHPLDPANRYLYHAAIESSEVLNLYSGNITTDANGEAAIALPEWFEAVNKDFRYQLTVVGAFAQAIVGNKIKDNRFTIKTSQPNVEVSWQVTGVRSDPAMLKHPFRVEVEKTASERGHYLTPEAFGQTQEQSLKWTRHPGLRKQMQERNEQFRLKRQGINR
jgi:trimeric autotransporter adhesin